MPRRNRQLPQQSTWYRSIRKQPRLQPWKHTPWQTLTLDTRDANSPASDFLSRRSVVSRTPTAITGPFLSIMRLQNLVPRAPRSVQRTSSSGATKKAYDPASTGNQCTWYFTSRDVVRCRNTCECARSDFNTGHRDEYTGHWRRRQRDDNARGNTGRALTRRGVERHEHASRHRGQCRIAKRMRSNRHERYRPRVPRRRLSERISCNLRARRRRECWRHQRVRGGKSSEFWTLCRECSR